MSDRRDFDVERLQQVSGLSRFDLVNVVRKRADDLAGGSPARLPLARQKNVSMAMREISRGKIATAAAPGPKAHVIEPSLRHCISCGFSEEDIIDGRAPGSCKV